MQAKNRNFSDFSLRTEILATKLGVRLIDLPDHLGISKAMLFAYRKDAYPISGKAWAKLEAAERAAGIGAPSAEAARTQCGPLALPSHRPGLPSLDAMDELLAGLSPEVRPAVQAIRQLLAAQTAEMESRFDAIESHLNALRAGKNPPEIEKG